LSITKARENKCKLIIINKILLQPNLDYTLLGSLSTLLNNIDLYLNNLNATYSAPLLKEIEEKYRDVILAKRKEREQACKKKKKKIKAEGK
jgi:hypothetical protein